jgi:nitrite reductase/ring-hydroxylating ferredoxin subunit
MFCFYWIIFSFVNIGNAFLLSSFSYKNIPPFFRNWQCVGLVENIDTSKPYAAHIGDLPLVFWKSENKWNARINICNHMGSKLDQGRITEKGCLKCPYHGLEFDSKNAVDVLGEACEIDGKLYWAYFPVSPKPPLVPFYKKHEKNQKYMTSYLEIDMESSLPDSALNTMDLRHPEFVHFLGFGNSIPPENIRHYFYPSFSSPALSPFGMPETDRVGLSFDYISSKIMKQIHNDMKVTKNFHMYQYPSFSWSRVSFQDKHLFIGVNLLPLEKNKTRWYITIRHNYYTSDFGKQFIKMLAMTILSQDHRQMRFQSDENELKQRMLLEYVFPEEALIVFMSKNWFSTYRYPDMIDCVQLYSSHKNTIL